MVLGPQPALNIEEQRVHIWTASLACEADVLQQFEATLSPDERARASRFVFPEHRDHFVVARGILRTLLGQYTHQTASAIKFRYEGRGKPSLQPRESDPPIRFNVSHSHGVAAFAFARGREVGVDVEAIRSDVGAEELATRFFSSPELAEFRGLPSEQRNEGFFLCWTRKEAYVKALGGGLSIPLDSFTVSLTPAMPDTLSGADCGRWTLRSFQPWPGYAGAVVAEGHDWTLQCRNWRAEPLE